MNEFEKWKAQQVAAWLEGIRTDGLALKLLGAEIDDLRAMAMPAGISYDKANVASSPRKDGLENATVLLVGMLDDYIAELNVLLERRREAHVCIGFVCNKQYESVLTYYYLLGMRWDDVAKKMGYARGYCMRLRDEALAEAFLFMPEEYKTAVPRADPG